MLISSEFGETAAYGLCVLYILGSGLAKLRIGGGFRWSSPETLRSILGTFAHKTPKQGGPILAFANRFVRKHDWICGFLGFTTLLFECLLAPLMAFFLPPQWRLITVGLGMVLLHLGIVRCKVVPLVPSFFPIWRRMSLVLVTSEMETICDASLSVGA